MKSLEWDLMDKHDVDHKLARRAASLLAPETIANIIVQSETELKDAYFAAESEIELAKEQVELNPKYMDALEIVKTFKQSLGDTVKPYKVANELRKHFLTKGTL
jgi:hypothetical protein